VEKLHLKVENLHLKVENLHLKVEKLPHAGEKLTEKRSRLMAYDYIPASTGGFHAALHRPSRLHQEEIPHVYE
jgi:hypothetical protein